MLEAGRGQQVQDAVIPGTGGLGSEGGGEADEGVVVLHLGGDSAEGAPGVALCFAVAGSPSPGAPAAQDHPHGGPVPTGQVCQPVVGEEVAQSVGAHEALLRQGSKHLVGPGGG